MKKQGWKIIAIVFISLFVLQSFIFGGLYIVGSNMIKKETDCGNICDKGDYDSYFYNDYYKTCYCFEKGELAFEEVL